MSLIILTLFITIPFICISITIKADGPWETVWDYATERCFQHDLPDIPARAFKMDNGTIYFLDSNSYGFLKMTGPTLQNLTRDCNNPVITSGDREPYANPNEYNNSIWIQAIWRDIKDETIVYAIIHNEFHGEQQINTSGYCPSANLNNCWYANTLSAISKDGGNHFQMYNIPQRTSIVSPFKYIPDAGRQGMSAVTNILSTPQNDGYFYMWALRSFSANNVKPNGMCLWRTSNLSNPQSWKGYNHTSNTFNVVSVDPYYSKNFDPNDHVCDITESLSTECRFSWTYNTVINQYISVGLKDNATFSDGSMSDAVTYCLGKNLFEWEEPVPFLKINSTESLDTEVREFYPSLIDPTSKGVNYEYTNENPYLYLTRFDPYTKEYNKAERDIVRVPLKITL
eukprot:326036_1